MEDELTAALRVILARRSDTSWRASSSAEDYHEIIEAETKAHPQSYIIDNIYTAMELYEDVLHGHILLEDG